MKKSDTLFRHKANLLYETGASIREMVCSITSRTGSREINLVDFADNGICDRVGAWIMDNDGETGLFGIFTKVYKEECSQRIMFVVQAEDCARDEDMYDYTLDELIYLHDEIEKIYKATR